jgi:polyferredoxin
MFKLTIDGKQVEAQQGQSLLEIALSNDIHIPRLCYEPTLSSYGACRLCVVEVGQNGRSWITTSCTYPAAEGMTIKTDTPEVRQARKAMAGLILSCAPNVPAIQRAAAAQGVYEPPFTTKNPDEMCILCGLCVRACQEIAGHGVLAFVDRGTERRVTTAFNQKHDVCADCNQCIPYCPTGAITNLEGPAIGQELQQKAHRWMKIRQVVQYALLALFVVLIAFTNRDLVDSPIKVNLFSLLDPLQAITASVASRELIPWYGLSLVTVGATLIFGRVWCGWICPLGAILELFGKPGRLLKQQSWRYVKYGVLYVLILMAIVGSMAFLWFDPITILIRGMAGTLNPAIQETLSGFEKPGRIGLVAAIPLLIVLGLNLIERRFWCRYICPLGALVGLFSKVSWFKRRVDKFGCVQCGECAQICTMGAIEEGAFTSDPAECIVCMDCAVPCPQRAISFEPRPGIAGSYEFDPGRREALVALGTAAAALALVQVDFLRGNASHLIRPPGVTDEDDFLAKCIRCGQCVKACSTNALHPATLGAGWDAFGTPVLIGSLGYCDYNCNACGHVCPSGAIPPLELAEKQQQVMGIAQVIPDLCISCGLCWEACPIEGALFEVETTRKRKTVIIPEVAPELCIGCGACETVCPVEGELAIKVFAPGELPVSQVARRRTTDKAIV